jgi:hypothetical protein
MGKFFEYDIQNRSQFFYWGGPIWWKFEGFQWNRIDGHPNQIIWISLWHPFQCSFTEKIKFRHYRKLKWKKKELFKHINPNNKNWDEKTEMKMENKKKFIWKEIFPRPHYKTEIFLENYRNVADFPFTILQRSNNRFFLLLLCLFREKIS